MLRAQRVVDHIQPQSSPNSSPSRVRGAGRVFFFFFCCCKLDTFFYGKKHEWLNVVFGFSSFPVSTTPLDGSRVVAGTRDFLDGSRVVAWYTGVLRPPFGCSR